MESENTRSCCLLSEIFLFLELQPRSVLKPHTHTDEMLFTTIEFWFSVCRFRDQINAEEELYVQLTQRPLPL